MIAALNKYYRPVSVDEFYNVWDLPTCQNAVDVAEFPEHIAKYIFEEKADNTKKINDAYDEYLKALEIRPVDLALIQPLKEKYYRALSEPTKAEKDKKRFQVITD